jgi:hypothetical protein
MTERKPALRKSDGDWGTPAEAKHLVRFHSERTKSDTIFPGQAAAIIRFALNQCGYSDAQADARMSAFLTEQSNDRT